MKKIFTIFAVITSIVLSAQVKSVTVSMGNQYANDVYFSLSQDSITGTPSGTNWTVGISPASQSSSIIINGGRAVQLWEIPDSVLSVANFANTLDTTDAVYLTWTKNFDEDSSWIMDAFSKNATGPNPPPPATPTTINFGWGNYVFATQQVLGSRLYLLQTRTGDLYKVFVESKIQGTTRFRYATLDNSFDTTMVVVGADYPNRNYVYINMDEHEIVDRDPLRVDWDLLFTRMQPNQLLPPPGNSFSRTGVYTNTINLSANPATPNIQGIEVARVEDFSINDSDYADAVFKSTRDVIANRWQTTSMGQFIVFDTIGFFIKDRNTDIYKLWFTAIEGSSTGNISFNYEKVFEFEEPNSINGVVADIDFHTIYPNPSNNVSHLLFSSKENRNNVKLNVYGISGNLVDSFDLNVNAGLNTISLNVSKYNSGMYIVQLNNGSYIATQKLIVK